MNEPLRPLNLAEILDRTAQLYRSRFLVFLGVSTIPAGTIFVFAAGAFAFVAWMGSNSRNGGSVADVFVWVFLILLGVLVVPVALGASSLGAAAMSDASARMFLGEAITIRSSYKNVWKSGWRYMGLYVLQGLVIFGLPVVVFSIAIFAMIVGKVSGYAAGDNSPLFGGLLFLLFIVLGAFAVWMLLRFCLAFPTCVVEQATAWTALKRGIGLSHGTRGRILVLYILGMVLNWMLTWAVTFIVVIAVAMIPSLQGQKHSQAVGMIMMFSLYGSYFAVKALIKPIYGIALTIFYFDQRIRKEAFDIELLMHQAGMVPIPQPVADPVPAAVPNPDVQSAEPSLPQAAAVDETIVAIPMENELPQPFPAQNQDLASASGEVKA
ncbi:MAG TPA: hypothetical protein VGI45_16100 [Terracidiphilus sp.]|jgi:hypothetical protein